jgi:thiol-disulfide isomerase/thioredoxin
VAQRSSRSPRGESKATGDRRPEPATRSSKTRPVPRRQPTVARKRSGLAPAAVLATTTVVLAVLVILLVSVFATSPSAAAAYGTMPAPASITKAISHVPAAAFSRAGSAATSSGPYAGGITVLHSQSPLSEDHKPLIVYVGANWCPYCAATRWPLAVALSRFGTFKGLELTQSSLTDDPSAINSLSFYGSTYASRYLGFLPTEQCSDMPASGSTKAAAECNGYTPLQPLSLTAARVFDKYDFAPYVPASSAGGIPFIAFANAYVEKGALIDPSIISAMTHLAIAKSLAKPTGSPGRTILAAANDYTAAICKLTGSRPGKVCQMPAVAQAGAQLP